MWAKIRRSIKSNAVKTSENFYDKIWRRWYRYTEFRKFRNPERKKIHRSQKLTKEQKENIDKFYLKNYGEKIPYTWHKHYKAFTNEFDYGYFPEILYTPEFEYFMNPYKDYCEAFADKNILPLIADSLGLNTPKTILGCVCGMFLNAAHEYISYEQTIKMLFDIGVVFAKPSVDTGSGVGCMLLNIKNGIDVNSGKKISEVIEDLGENFVIQERIKCHNLISEINESSVNTFRIITYRWKDNIYHMPIIMRMGMNNSYLDNAHAGGAFIGVYEDGRLCSTAFTELNFQYNIHPNSGIEFAKHKIQGVDKVISAAKKAHANLAMIGVINWDFTVDTCGEPLLIEANLLGGSPWMAQMAWGKGPFGERTGEVLRWLRLMKRTPASHRTPYYFGKGV